MNREPKKELSPSEWKVMNIVWDLKSCAARDVYRITKEKYGWSPNTTKTYLFRLVEKGHLSTTQIGNSYLYQPTDSVVESLQESGESLMKKAPKGTEISLLFHMIQKGKLSKSDMDELEALLDDFKKHEKRG